MADPDSRRAIAAALDRSGQAYIEPPPLDTPDPWALNPGSGGGEEARRAQLITWHADDHTNDTTRADDTCDETGGAATVREW